MTISTILSYKMFPAQKKPGQWHFNSNKSIWLADWFKLQLPYRLAPILTPINLVINFSPKTVFQLRPTSNRITKLLLITRTSFTLDGLKIALSKRKGGINSFDVQPSKLKSLLESVLVGLQFRWWKSKGIPATISITITQKMEILWKFFKMFQNKKVIKLSLPDIWFLFSEESLSKLPPCNY